MKMIANNAVVVHRDGKSVKIKTGESFDFTKEEVAELTKSGALREPVNETPAVHKKVMDKLMKLTAKMADAKDDAAKAKIKEDVRKFCEENGVDVPEGFAKEGDL